MRLFWRLHWKDAPKEDRPTKDNLKVPSHFVKQSKDKTPRGSTVPVTCKFWYFLFNTSRSRIGTTEGLHKKLKSNYKQNTNKQTNKQHLPWAHWNGSLHLERDWMRSEHSSVVRGSPNLIAPAHVVTCMHMWGTCKEHGRTHCDMPGSWVR